MSNNSTKPQVLLVDDETHVRHYMKSILTKMNCDVIGEGQNGTEAVELYKKHIPNLIFLDVNMPGKNGNEALMEIIAEFPKAFVIMLSSVSDMETVKKCIELGARNYILKSASLNEIKLAIKESWDEYRSENRG
jgi:two-component system, chemotaxis family, chemotaxis protein CheY